MKADFIKDKVRLFNCDCMDFMAEIPDNYYALAIVDPPYGININKIWGDEKHGYKQYETKQWDSNIPDGLYFKELLRVSKKQIIWGGNYFTRFLNPTGGWVIWDKGQRNFSLAEGETEWTSFLNSVRFVNYPRALSNRGKRIHITQKPIQFYKWLLTNYAKPNDKIFDSHGGSFSSACAALDMGFEFDGCELDKDYFKDAVNRLENHNQLFMDI